MRITDGRTLESIHDAMGAPHQLLCGAGHLLRCDIAVAEIISWAVCYTLSSFLHGASDHLCYSSILPHQCSTTVRQQQQILVEGEQETWQRFVEN